MDFSLESSVFNRSTFVQTPKNSFFPHQNRCSKSPVKISPGIQHYPKFHVSKLQENKIFDFRNLLKPTCKFTAELGRGKNEVLDSNIEKVKILMKGGVVLGALVCGVLVFGCKRVLAVESAVNAGYGVIGQSILLLKMLGLKFLGF